MNNSNSLGFTGISNLGTNIYNFFNSFNNNNKALAGMIIFFVGILIFFFYKSLLDKKLKNNRLSGLTSAILAFFSVIWLFLRLKGGRFIIISVTQIISFANNLVSLIILIIATPFIIIPLYNYKKSKKNQGEPYFSNFLFYIAIIIILNIFVSNNLVFQIFSKIPYIPALVTFLNIYLFFVALFGNHNLSSTKKEKYDINLKQEVDKEYHILKEKISTLNKTITNLNDYCMKLRNQELTNLIKSDIQTHLTKIITLMNEIIKGSSTFKIRLKQASKSTKIEDHLRGFFKNYINYINTLSDKRYVNMDQFLHDWSNFINSYRSTIKPFLEELDLEFKDLKIFLTKQIENNQKDSLKLEKLTKLNMILKDKINNKDKINIQELYNALAQIKVELDSFSGDVKTKNKKFSELIEKIDLVVLDIKNKRILDNFQKLLFISKDLDNLINYLKK